jgi:hypothetical protein
MPITDAQILALEPKAKPYKVYIGDGAYVLVMPNGHKYWRLKYHLNAREGGCGLGVFPEVSVKAAKAARDAARTLIRKGINPADAKRQAKRQAALREPLFLLALSNEGALTVETETNQLILTSPETQALTAFLNTIPKHTEASNNVPHGHHN